PAWPTSPATSSAARSRPQAWAARFRPGTPEQPPHPAALFSCYSHLSFQYVQRKPPESVGPDEDVSSVGPLALIPVVPTVVRFCKRQGGGHAHDSSPRSRSPHGGGDGGAGPQLLRELEVVEHDGHDRVV